MTAWYRQALKKSDRPLFVLVLLGLTGLAGAPAQAPVAGRPRDFSGAVGSYRISTRAHPTELQAEDPLTFTVRITGTGPLETVERPDLRRLPRFAERFHIEDAGERLLAANQGKEFDYRLRPRSAAVKEIPPLPFSYYKPGFVPEERGFQTTYAPPIPLVVRPRAGPEVREHRPRADTPDSLYQIVEGPALLRTDATEHFPGTFALGTFLLAPPLVGLVGGLLWRRLHPDAGRHARRQQSRAARHALQALRHSQTSGVARSRAVLAEYLHQRAGLAAAEPTALEVAACLRRGGWSETVAEEAAGWFAACDAARFGPASTSEDGASVARAVRLVESVERYSPRPARERDQGEGASATWPPSPS
jgi:hypothetical protein